MRHRSQILRVHLMWIIFSFAYCFWIASSPLLCFSYGIDYISLIRLKFLISLPAHTFITLTDMNHITFLISLPAHSFITLRDMNHKTNVYTSFWLSRLRTSLAGLYYTIVFTIRFIIWHYDKEDKYKTRWNKSLMIPVQFDSNDESWISIHYSKFCKYKNGSMIPLFIVNGFTQVNHTYKCEIKYKSYSCY